MPNIAISGEVTAFKLPDNIVRGDSGHYIDYDFYATLNFTNYIGVQGGYRTIDAGYIIKTDTGSFVLKGAYIGVVARF